MQPSITRPILASVFPALLALAPPAAVGQDMLWVTQFGTSAADHAWALAPDGAGGVFAAGATQGSIGGPNQGGNDAWLARYDASGERLWITQLGTPQSDLAVAVAPDGDGGFFAAGITGGDLGGPNQGKEDPWLARFDASGTQLWITQLGTPHSDYAYALAPDGAGGVYIAGNTLGDLGGPNGGGSDAWLARYDGSGSQVWITQFNISQLDSARGLAPDGGGGVFIAGWFVANYNADAYIARYDASGSQAWITTFGSPAGDEPQAAAPDGAGGVFIAGWTEGSLGGPNQGSGDAWLARHDASGSQLWITQVGTAANDGARALAPDGAGGVFIAGHTSGSLGGPNQGSGDAWLARYDASGAQGWLAQFGSPEEDYAWAAAPDGAGGVYIAGRTNGSLGGPNAGEYDGWLARFTGGDEPGCYPDLDGNGVLNLFDFLAFANLFNTSDPAADCDGNKSFNLFDFLCFTNAFNKGC